MSGPEAHHELGASGASRYLNCVGSVVAQRGKPNESSVYAEEGTSAHELGEGSLNFWKKVVGSSRAIMDWSKAAKAAGYNIPEMNREVDKYVEYVKDLCNGDPDALTVEMRVSLAPAIDGGFGTSDTVVVNRSNPDTVDADLGNGAALMSRPVESVHIADLKYGKGKQIFAENNEQLRLYAYGVINGLIDQGILDDMIDDFDTLPVHLHICQPRLNHFDSEELTVTTLLQWVDEVVIPTVARIEDGDETRVSGEWCTFCRDSATCRTLAEGVAESLADDWDTFIDEGPNIEKAANLTPEEIGKALAFKKRVESWFEELAGHAYAEIENGEDIPGWKLVEGNKQQKCIVDTEELLKAFKGQRAIPMDVYAPRSVMSPPQAVAALPAGSKVLKLIDATGRNKPSLVELSNKKPALVFGKLEDDFDDELFD